MTDIAETSSEFIKDLGDAARRNPISAALIGMGIVWLFAGGKAGIGPVDILQRSGMDGVPELATRNLHAVRDGVASATNSAVDAIREAGNAGIESASRMGSEYASLVPDSANVLDAVRSNLTDLFKAQPLALGAIGLAIGAGIAAALPITEAENSCLGETSESLRRQAAGLADQQIGKATTLATNVVEAAVDSARAEGLTIDGAKAAMEDLSSKVGRVVDAAGMSVSQNAR